ncbi:unnamed protein product [Closterium sp. Naga37s-1]|nr:unnamed protein product [Closterium sp. Naga37s-1]
MLQLRRGKLREGGDAEGAARCVGDAEAVAAAEYAGGDVRSRRRDGQGATSCRGGGTGRRRRSRRGGGKGRRRRDVAAEGRAGGDEASRRRDAQAAPKQARRRERGDETSRRSDGQAATRCRGGRMRRRRRSRRGGGNAATRRRGGGTGRRRRGVAAAGCAGGAVAGAAAGTRRRDVAAEGRAAGRRRRGVAAAGCAGGTESGAAARRGGGDRGSRRGGGGDSGVALAAVESAGEEGVIAAGGGGNGGDGIGNDASQFVGPLMLSRLLSAMQSSEPAWHGYIYASIIFLGLVGGVICEAQYFQSVMRVGFQLRQAMVCHGWSVAAVFSKSLRLSHSGRQGFSTGRITNMMTNDAESLQMVCQQLHGLWSAPLRILVCIFLLYQQLGVSSLLGLLMLLLMILAQAMIINRVQKLVKASLQRSNKRVALMNEAVIVNRVQKLVKASLQRSDKRVALMSEVLAAMDVVKLYTWEGSFQSKVARVRAVEMGQISKAQYIMAVGCVRCDEVERKLVKASLQRSDKRVALMSEVLAAMDVVKLYTWEGSFQSKVARVRADEMGQISKAQYIMAVGCVRCDEVERINFLLMSVLPVLVTVVSFGCYSLLGHQLTAAKTFTSISLFAVLHYPLHMFPNLITQVNAQLIAMRVVNEYMSLTRLQALLLADMVVNVNVPAEDASGTLDGHQRPCSLLLSSSASPNPTPPPPPPPIYPSVTPFHQVVNVNVSLTRLQEMLLADMVVNVNVSLTRLQEMLLADETDIDAPALPVDPTKPAVEVSHASFAWCAANSAPTAPANRAPTAATANGAARGRAGGGGEGKEKGGVGGEGKEKDVGGTLTDVTLLVEPGKLVAVVGATGQGKSSLVSALLGEMPMVSGDSPPIIRGRVAYVSQVSWIFNATVRDNILFGLPYDKQRYERAVEVSALERDLELLPALLKEGTHGDRREGDDREWVAEAAHQQSLVTPVCPCRPLSSLPFSPNPTTLPPLGHQGGT